MDTLPDYEIPKAPEGFEMFDIRTPQVGDYMVDYEGNPRRITESNKEYVFEKHPVFRPIPDYHPPWDLDINCSTRDELKTLAQKLRNAIRKHRDAKGHDLCWLNNLELYAALPETVAPNPQVPPWPEFMAGCVAYRKSLDNVPQRFTSVSEFARSEE